MTVGFYHVCDACSFAAPSGNARGSVEYIQSGLGPSGRAARPCVDCDVTNHQCFFCKDFYFFVFVKIVVFKP